MKSTIFGFSQAKLCEHELDCVDIVLLDYLMKTKGKNGLQRITENDLDYVWLEVSKITNDLPFLNLKERGMYNRLDILCNKNMIKKIVKCDKGNSIKKTFYAVPSEVYDLKCSEEEKGEETNNNERGIEKMYFKYANENVEFCLQHELTCEDLLIIKYISVASQFSTKQDTYVNEKGVYVWIKTDKMLEELPMLYASNITLLRKINALCSKGIIEKVVKCENKTTLKKSYYRIANDVIENVF